MPRQFISPEIKEQVLRLTAEQRRREEIRDITGVAESTQRRICAIHRETGRVVYRAVVSGRRRKLNAMDVMVCSNSYLYIYSYRV